jgi:hypothetical protein
MGYRSIFRGTTGYAINPARDLGPRIMHAILPKVATGLMPGFRRIRAIAAGYIWHYNDIKKISNENNIFYTLSPCLGLTHTLKKRLFQTQ